MKRKLPHFRSAEEEAKFWDTHDVTDYLKQFRTVDELFVLSPSLAKKIRERAKKRLISLRLSNWEIAKAKEVATKQKMPYQTLLRQWIDEGIKRAYRSAA